jgi:hypothetical protein
MSGFGVSLFPIRKYTTALQIVMKNVREQMIIMKKRNHPPKILFDALINFVALEIWLFIFLNDKKNDIFYKLRKISSSL